MWSGLLRALRLGPSPHPLLVENRRRFVAFDQKRPLADYRFVVLDTELSGLNHASDEIVSIGAVAINGLQIDLGATYSTLVQPRSLAHGDSTLVHRLTPEQLAQAPTLEEVLPDFVAFCEGALLVGHCIGIDMGFLNRACRRILGDSLANPCIDTIRLARVYNEEQWEGYYDQFDLKVSYQLEDLARQYNLPSHAAHDAMEDALQTAYLFLFLLKKLRRGGIETLAQLHRAGGNWRWIY